VNRVYWSVVDRCHLRRKGVGVVASPLCHAVHSFEAVPETFDLLRRNVQVNGLANVFANPCAVSDSCGEVRIFEGDLSSIDKSSLRAPPCSSGRSSVVRLSLVAGPSGTARYVAACPLLD